MASTGTRILAVVGGQLLSVVVLVAGMRLITELVDAAVFGEARLAIGLANLVGAIAVQPFSQYAMRGYHDAAATGSVTAFERFARRSNTGAAMGSGWLAAALWIGYGALADRVDWLLALAVGLYVLGEAKWSLERSLLVTRDRQTAASTVEIAMQVVLIGAAVAGVALIENRALGLVGAQGVALVGAGAWLVRVTRRMPEDGTVQPRRVQVGKATWRSDSIGFVAPLAIVSMARWFMNVGDRYLLDYMRGGTAVGHYSAVYGLCSAPLMVCSGMVARLLYSPWFRREARGERDDELFARMLALAATIAGIGLLTAWAFGDILVSVALAEGYRGQAHDLMIWLVAGYGLLVVAAPFEMRAYARRTTWALGAGWAAAASVNLALNLIWIPLWGPLGAARATLAGFVVYLAVLWWVTARGPQASSQRSGGAS
jgi:O-antigen/teichoic acid export membrane protein